MGIGLSGMISGLDTDTLIKQLMSAERTRVTKVENKITKNEWMTEKWKDLNTKIYSLYTGSLSKMRTQGNYLTKKTTSSKKTTEKKTEKVEVKEETVVKEDGTTGIADDISIENVLRQSIQLIAQLPMIMTYAYQVKRRYYLKKSMYLHPMNPELSTAETILRFA